MTIDRRAVVFAAAALAAALIAPPQASAEPVKIRIAWSTTPSHITPLLPEIPKEVYRHWGKSYVVEPVFIAGSGPMLTALAAGEVQLAGYGYQTFALSVVNANIDNRAIAGVLGNKAPYSDNGFWVKADSGINKITDLKGKRLAINARGSGIDASLRKMLLDHSLEDGRDYQIVEVRFSAMMAALDSGRVDMAFFVLPFDLTAEKNPKFKKLFTLRDALGPNETVLWGVLTSFLNKNRAALVDFLEDNIRARRWLYDPKNHDAAVKMLAKVTKLPEKDFEGWVFTEKDTYRSMDATFDIKLLQQNVDDLHRLKVTPGTLDVVKYSDLTLVEEAKARLAR
jgi:NitT/TauT family transport system substrate-binding protein